MALYRDNNLQATIQYTMKIIGPEAFGMPNQANTTAENTPFAEGATNVSFAAFFTKDSSGYMIPATASTLRKDLYYGTDYNTQWNPLQAPAGSRAQLGFIDDSSVARNRDFRFMPIRNAYNSLGSRGWIHAIGIGAASGFAKGDVVAVGANGRLVKFTDPDTQIALNFEIAAIESQRNAADTASITILRIRPFAE